MIFFRFRLDIRFVIMHVLPKFSSDALPSSDRFPRDSFRIRVDVVKQFAHESNLLARHDGGGGETKGLKRILLHDGQGATVCVCVCVREKKRAKGIIN